MLVPRENSLNIHHEVGFCKNIFGVQLEIDCIDLFIGVRNCSIDGISGGESFALDSGTGLGDDSGVGLEDVHL